MKGDNTYSRYEEQPREHTRLLMPMIREVLEEAGVDLQDLDAIVLGNGPGSFIGLRIAASVAQGMAHGAGLRVAPVSSLAAVGLRAGSPGDVVAVTQDAHLNEVYLGIYRIGEDKVLEPVTEERLQRQQVIPELAGFERVVAAGCGWQRYPELARLNAEHVDIFSDSLYPSADALLELGKAAVRQGGLLLPEEVNPAYLRQKVAEKPAASR